MAQVQGVKHTKEVLEKVAELAVDGIAIAKKGAGVRSFMKLFEVMSDLKGLLEAAPLAVPELADLDAQEAAEVAQAAFVAVQRIVEAAKA